MARLGMDVDSVERIGHGLQTDADALTALTSRIDATVRRLVGVWDGRDSTEFVGTWWPQHRSSLQQVQEQIRGLGQSALDNASDQRRASDSTGAGASGGGHEAPRGSADDGGWWLQQAGLLHDGTELVTDVSKTPVPRVFDALGPVLGVLGVGVGVYDGVQAARSGDVGGAVGDGVDVALSTAGFVVAPEVVVPLAIGKAFVDATIPYSAASQNSLLDFEAKRAFGVGTSGLTPAQSAQLASHYSGAMGPLNMISDKMDQSYDTAANAVGGMVSSGVDGVKAVASWLSR